MKKIYTLLFIYVFTTLGFSQGVGVNTENPQGILHINGKPNDNLSTDDVIVENITGRIGVGTITPKAKLDINVAVGQTALNITDGDQQVDKMLLSQDESGAATWYTKPIPVLDDTGVLNNGGIAFGSSGGGTLSDITTEPLKLASGKWIIFVKYTSNGNAGGFNVWLHLYNRTVNTGPVSFGSGALTIVGTTPQRVSPYYATPSLMHLVDIPPGVTHEFRAYASSSSTVPKTSDQLQGSYFYAIKVDDNF